MASSVLPPFTPSAPAAVRPELAFVVRRETARDEQRRAAARTLGVERREPLDAIGPGLEPGMHRTHQDAVRQANAAYVERLEQVLIGHG